MGLCLPRSLVQQQPSLPRFLHHAPDLTPVIPLLCLLLPPVLVAPVLGVCGRDSGSACGRFRSCTETTVQPTPAFTLDGELRTRRIRASLGAAPKGCLGRIIHRLMYFLKTWCPREGVRLISPHTTSCEANVI